MGTEFVLDPEKRMAGILAPLFAVRGTDDFGLGDTETLRETADWCARNGFGVLQILPINETGGDHSPYNILSSMALEPSTISVSPRALPDILPRHLAKVATEERLTALRQGDVQYDRAKALKWELLRLAFANFRKVEKSGKSQRFAAFLDFCKREAGWLDAYVLYRALMALHAENEVIESWPEEHRTLAEAREWLAAQPLAGRRRLRESQDFYRYVQWIAHTQWQEASDYCRSRGVALMGDIPVGVSLYSADVFAEPEIFDRTRSCGAPPERVFAADPFTEKWGQNWGFPLYKWEAMERDNYAWWRRRLRAMRGIFHLMRVDHALGFFRIYSFPWRPEINAEFLPLSQAEAMERTGQRLPCFMMRDDSTLENQMLNREQGLKLLRMILEETGKYRIIAEDLGEVAPYVRPVLAALEIPGFKIPQWERGEDHQMVSGGTYSRLSLATYATHDHEPLRKMWDEWVASLESSDGHRVDLAKRGMRELLDFADRGDLSTPRPYDAEVRESLLTGLYRTNSWLAVNMITDVFGLVDRFNVPGAIDGRNWTRRLDNPVSEWDTAWREEIAAHRRACEKSGR